MGEIKNESFGSEIHLKAMEMAKFTETVMEIPDGMTLEKADGIYSKFEDGIFSTEYESGYRDLPEDYDEKLSKMPISNEVYDEIVSNGYSFKDYCDMKDIPPEDLYEPTIEPYHLKRMEEWGVDIEEYCGIECLNVYDLLIDASVLNDLYDKDSAREFAKDSLHNS